MSLLKPVSHVTTQHLISPPASLPSQPRDPADPCRSNLPLSPPLAWLLISGCERWRVPNVSGDCHSTPAGEQLDPSSCVDCMQSLVDRCTDMILYHRLRYNISLSLSLSLPLSLSLTLSLGSPLSGERSLPAHSLFISCLSRELFGFLHLHHHSLGELIMGLPVIFNRTLTSKL